jgi:outer membrane lipoprotein SlyB
MHVADDQKTRTNRGTTPNAAGNKQDGQTAGTDLTQAGGLAGGGIAGAALGSLAGPAGTVAGGIAGAALGNESAEAAGRRRRDGAGTTAGEGTTAGDGGAPMGGR